MTAQLLPPIVTSPFGRRFDTHPYALHDAALSQTPASASAPSVNILRVVRPRQASPASILSIASAPQPTNNENLAPLIQHGNTSRSSILTISSAQTSCRKLRLKGDSALEQLEASTPTLSQPRHLFDKSAIQQEERDASPGEDTSILRNALKGIEKYKTSKPGPNTPSTPDVSIIAELEAATPEASMPACDGVEQALHMAPITGAIIASVPHARSETDETSAISSELTPIGHRNRLSTNSSGFVHTVKTASFSNGSFSMMSKSLHLGRSSETHALFGSHSRFSTDSERPPTNYSVDEAALRRSVKRRQILEEMVTTEETYISDLKALVYLMSTLLASATSISSRLRHSMQQNVLTLLHLHEKILEKMHRAAFRAAARKWADTTSSQGPSSPHQTRWRTMEPSAAGRLARVHRRTRSSIDSKDVNRTRARLLGAEPADIIDIVDIYKESISNFFAYEEYCANHEIIAHDLQRHLPTLWSSYEAGIESLARSLMALDRRNEDSRKALTVGDLLIKPIQRICKYPLLFDDLLKQTPVSDCPSAHVEVESLLQRLRDIVDAVNNATYNPDVRVHIHRRWSLQARLSFHHTSMAPEDLRLLGNANLCGVLYVTYQTGNRVDGAYALCILYRHAFLVAFPAGASGMFDITAVVKLADLKVESSSDGKGLQAPSAFHTWKLCFAIEGSLHEFILSACSATEEEQWTKGLRGESTEGQDEEFVCLVSRSYVGIDLKSVGVVYGHHGTLARRLSVQRAATVGNRASIYQVIVRNTHSPEELHEFRQPSTSSINRSHSHMTTNRIVVLAPKRSERARLETMLGDVWTKDKLPYPGMIASRGGQIIRASAGSLVRKLSLASLHAPFSRRSASLSMSTKKSYETFSEMARSRDRIAPTFEIRRDSIDDKTPKLKRKTSHDVPELDTMDRVVNRMIGDTKQVAFAADDGVKRKGTLRKSPIQVTALPVGPDDSAEAFYPEEVEKMQQPVSVEDALKGSKKKRWSNPFGILKRLPADGFRHMLYSSK